MKFRTGTAFVLLGFAAITVILLLNAVYFGRTSGSSNEQPVSADAALPPYVMSETNPAFGPECGDDGHDVGGGGFSFNPDLGYHAENSIAIVEGTARVAGPARFGGRPDSSDTDKSRRFGSALGINTPFVIEVSKTHKGPEKPEWMVSQPGGLVGCVSYRQSAVDTLLFDGAQGLFFISAEPREFQANWVSMTIAQDGPEWFEFTEEYFGSIDEAIKIIETVY